MSCYCFPGAINIKLKCPTLQHDVGPDAVAGTAPHCYTFSKNKVSDASCACVQRWAKKGKPETSTSKAAASNGASSAAVKSRSVPAVWDNGEQQRPHPQHAHSSNGSALLAGKTPALGSYN